MRLHRAVDDLLQDGYRQDYKGVLMFFSERGHTWGKNRFFKKFSIQDNIAPFFDNIREL